MKPREWMGYSVWLNDLLPEASEIIGRFEQTGVPLDDTFGSSSDPAVPPPPLIVYFGPGVEPQRLLDVLYLLPARVRCLVAGTTSEDRKCIFIGAYNDDHDQQTPFSDELLRRIEVPGMTPEELTSLVRDAARLRVVRP